jgi:hypothetical protein
MNKYRNVKTTVDGIKFDSQAEANRYCELKLLERAGRIKDLKLQPKFPILPGYDKNGKKIRPIYYIGDFAYIENGNKVVEDVKGMETKEFKLKKKMFEYQYKDIELRLIK